MTLRQWYYHLVHKMPCRVVHLLCSLCRDEGLCPHCIEKFWEIEDRQVTRGPRVVITNLPSGFTVAPQNSTTFGSGSTITIVKNF